MNTWSASAATAQLGSCRINLTPKLPLQKIVGTDLANNQKAKEPSAVRWTLFLKNISSGTFPVLPFFGEGAEVRLTPELLTAKQLPTWYAEQICYSQSISPAYHISKCRAAYHKAALRRVGRVARRCRRYRHFGLRSSQRYHCAGLQFRWRSIPSYTDPFCPSRGQ